MSMFKYALTLVAYAIALVLVGFVTYSVAPEGANAATALIISGVLAALAVACAVLSFMIKSNRTLGMIGIHLGLVVPLLAVAGTASRLPASLEATERGNSDLTTIREQAERTGGATLVKTEDEWELTFPESEVTVGMGNVLSPRGYQTVGIASTACLSAFAFIALLIHRPKVPPKASKGQA
jgi:hypothetical protein